MSATAWRLAAPAVLVCAVLAGCGDDNVVVRAAPTPAERGVAPPAGGTSPDDPLRGRPVGARRMEITVDDTGPGRFAYRAPSTVRGGLVEIRLRNVGEVPHKAQLWRISDKHTVKQALASFRARKPRPDWLLWGGGVSLTAPKQTSTTLQTLHAGRYLVSGTKDLLGSIAAFTVAAATAGRPVPLAPARIDMRDFTFRVSGLRAGRNTVDVDNTGSQPHFAYFTPMRPGADLADVRKYFGERSSIGQPPVDAEGTRETAVLEGGERQVTQLDLPAGRYALICFVRDGGGPSHLELGMINEVTVR